MPTDTPDTTTPAEAVAQALEMVRADIRSDALLGVLPKTAADLFRLGGRFTPAWLASCLAEEENPDD